MKFYRAVCSSHPIDRANDIPITLHAASWVFLHTFGTLQGHNMARKQRNNILESRTSRLKLAVRRRPYPGVKLGRGKQMQYRRNKGNGTWSAEGQRRSRQTMDQGLCPSRRFRRQRRQERPDLLRGAGHCERPDTRRRWQRRQRADHGGRCVDRLRNRSDSRAAPMPTMPNGRACISPARCCRSRWHCWEPPS